MKKTILVVDDNQSIIDTVKDQLSTLNPEWEVLPAISGKECLAVLGKKKVDLILLDIMMPEMDGWTVAASIKSKNNLKNIPIVFLTAKTDDLSKGMGQLTSDDYIEKPFDMMDLNNRIKKVLGI